MSGIALMLLFNSVSAADDSNEQTKKDNNKLFSAVEVANGLPKSWSINSSPDNRIFVVNRAGNIQIFDEKWNVNIILFQPDDLYYEGRGGLLDIEFHPQYLQNGWIYLSYSTGNDRANTLKVIRFKLSSSGTAVSQIEDIFVLNETRDTAVHYGGRLAFMADNSLLISSGDGFDYRERAQMLSSQQGKILRVSDTGALLKDNPFYQANNAAASAIFSLGHRNPQALLVSANNLVISNEHGPKGGDEINVIEKGINYGWPVVTNGLDYIGATISPFDDYPGMRLPAFDWTPSIAPSGMALFNPTPTNTLSSNDHSEQNDILQNGARQQLLVTSLKFKQLHALDFDGKLVSNDTVIFASDKRLRDVAVTHQGDILLLTDNEPATILMLQAN